MRRTPHMQRSQMKLSGDLARQPEACGLSSRHTQLITIGFSIGTGMYRFSHPVLGQQDESRMVYSAHTYLLNLVAVRYYGEVELVSASFNILMIELLAATFITMLGGNPKHDPMVSAVNGLAKFVNAIVLTSAWSCGNAYVYTSTRTLDALAINGKAP
ncbi:hypothetical protein B7494_g5100 [Chlorociboria aeruginascens]|nr:hypothetical protein B7494_g5100 [Chlorociboria aeruginascens]